jgi:threonine dehydrogenase-like Zn-dependent dehydrogenase
MKTRRAFLTAPREIEIRELDVQPGAGQILVKIAVCGICNWEQNHWKGHLGTCPQSLGHEWGGRVAAVGADVSDVAVGDGVTGMPEELAAFSDYIVASKGNYFKLASHIRPETALGEPLKCVVTVLRAVAPEAGDFGVVLGCGPMGLWCIQGLSGNLLSGLIAVDVDENKLQLARLNGATHSINPKEQDAIQVIREISDGRLADFVIEGTGVPSALNQAVAYLKEGQRPRLAMMSAHEAASGDFDFRPVQDKAITIIGAHPYYSHSEHDDMRRAVAFLNKGTFKMDGLISHHFPLRDVQAAFETCESKPKDYIKGVVVPEL